MRISDWSSDVCSSDLFGALEALEMAQAEHPMDVPRTIDDAGRDVVAAAEITDDRNPLECSVLFVEALPGAEVHLREASVPVEISVFGLDERSEEHTSELQSLMRTSYAVFCLKKK